MAKSSNREEWIKNSLRNIQNEASKIDEALARKEQEEENEQLAARIKERKAARKGLDVDEIIKSGTPEEKAALAVSDYDASSFCKGGFLSPENKKALKASIATYEDSVTFMGYLKLYSDLVFCENRLAYLFKRYQVEVALLSKLIDKYEAIQKDLGIYQAIYGERVGSGSGRGIKYNLTNDKTNAKDISQTTPEALLVEFNEVHKGDGVIFKDNVKGNLVEGTLYDGNGITIYGEINEDGSKTLIADIDFKGGLYDQIKDQAKECEKELSYVKGAIEAIEDYVIGNCFLAFVPNRMELTIENVKEERFSRSVIAPGYHQSQLNYKRDDKGETVTKEEEYEAVVPDYYEVQADEDVKEDFLKFIIKRRNERRKK